MPPKIDLKPHDWDELRRILETYLPDYTVWAFGSRVTGKAKPYSDLDLAVVGRQPLSWSEMARLTETFDESDLTIRVDLVDWATAGDAFKERIERDKVLIQGAKAAPAPR